MLHLAFEMIIGNITQFVGCWKMCEVESIEGEEVTKVVHTLSTEDNWLASDSTGLQTVINMELRGL